jgi:hypothetical protein
VQKKKIIDNLFSDNDLISLICRCRLISQAGILKKKPASSPACMCKVPAVSFACTHIVLSALNRKNRFCLSVLSLDKAV